MSDVWKVATSAACAAMLGTAFYELGEVVVKNVFCGPSTAKEEAKAKPKKKSAAKSKAKPKRKKA